MLDKALDDAPAGMPTPGEDAAQRRWKSFLDSDVDDYASMRDDPGADRTSRLSAYLKLGVVHPRQLLADTAGKRSQGATTFESELAWRDFYADVLHTNPRSAWADLNPVAGLTYDDPADAIEAWKSGHTGFPIVDAGMRQLLSEGWMHNRVRMITASFLTKDLHVWWPVGARHFLDHLVDGDLASNNHGWQWVAGTGTDASPYFRVFNPVTQGLKFDKGGDYVRRWIPELAHLPGKAAHEPWDAEDGYAHGYPRADHRPRGGASGHAGPLPARPRLNVSTTSWRALLSRAFAEVGRDERDLLDLPRPSTVGVQQPHPLGRLDRPVHPGEGEVGSEALAVHLGAGRAHGVARSLGEPGQLLGLGLGLDRGVEDFRPACMGKRATTAILASIGRRLRAASASRTTSSSYARSGTSSAKARVRCHCSGRVHRNGARPRRGPTNSSRSSRTSSGGSTATNMRVMSPRSSADRGASAACARALAPAVSRRAPAQPPMAVTGRGRGRSAPS